jgi:protein SCO1
MERPQPARSPFRPGILPLLAALLLVSVAAGVALYSGAMRGAPGFHGTAYEPPQPAAGFVLTDHTGREVRLADYQGRVVLLFFGFANCPDVCPLTLTKLDRALASLKADTSQVRVLLVTVDPERDTPDALARYVAGFGPHVSGLTADSATLAAVRQGYGAYAARSVGHGQHVDVVHTPRVFGIDRSGMLRVLIRGEEPDEVVAADIRTLLRLRG